MKVNKYAIDWQVIRVKARSIKNVSEKVRYVMDWFEKNQSWQNYERVLNWLKMTKVSYKDKAIRDAFDASIDLAIKSKELFTQEEKIKKLSEVDTADLILVYKDLQKRKYGFQYKKVPKSHTEFMHKLEKELEYRGVR